MKNAWWAQSIRGDADTTGAICGMLAGAYYGIDSIPRRWLKKMDRKVISEVEILAGRLVEASPAGSSLFLGA